MKGYILSPQASLFGQPDVIGFGDAGFCVREVNRDQANACIVANHYSRKFYNNSLCHLGVFICGHQVGVLQFGQAMNPASGGGIVAGSGVDDFFELNRMWLDDAAPHCSESRALSCALKFIRRKYPKIRWIQSFADERCGKFGAVYQAAGFGYFGEHTSIFWELDGIWYHNITATIDVENPVHLGRGRAGARILQANINRAVRHELRQFRYLYFMAPRFARGCRLKQQPYPKPSATCPLDAPAPTGLSGAQPPEVAPTCAEAA